MNDCQCLLTSDLAFMQNGGCFWSVFFSFSFSFFPHSPSLEQKEHKHDEQKHWRN